MLESSGGLDAGAAKPQATVGLQGGQSSGVLVTRGPGGRGSGGWAEQHLGQYLLRAASEKTGGSPESCKAALWE